MANTQIFTIINNHLIYNNEQITPKRFSITKHLGTGANGSVYKAHDTELDRTVALKFWKPEKEEKLKRAGNEIRKLASIDHDHFATVYDVCVTNNIIWMVMEFVDAIPLKQLISRNLSSEIKAKIWADFSSAMRILYKNNKLHGDPHTGNILVLNNFIEDKNNPIAIKIVDLGTSKIWNIQKSFVDREIKLLKETYYRLFPEHSSDFLFKGINFTSPALTLEILNASNDIYASLSTLKNLRENEQGNTYKLRATLANIANRLDDYPIFNFNMLWSNISKLHINEEYISYFFGLICAEKSPSKPDVSIFYANKYSIMDYENHVLPEYIKRQADWKINN